MTYLNSYLPVKANAVAPSPETEDDYGVEASVAATDLLISDGETVLHDDGLEVEAAAENYFSPLEDGYGDRPADVTRSQVLELFEKTSAAVRKGEADPGLLEILRDALREEASGHDEASAALYQEVAGEASPPASAAAETSEEGDELREASDDNYIEGEDDDDFTGSEADRIDGDTAIYDSRPSVEIKAEFGAVKRREVTIRDTLVLRGSSYADTMEIADYSEGPPQEWMIHVYKDGKQDADHKETLFIRGGENSKVVLDLMDKSSLEAGDESFLEHVSIGAQESSAEKAKKKSWPAESIKMAVTSDVDNDDKAKRFVSLLNAAVLSGDGASFVNQVNDLAKAPFSGFNVVNDVVRNVVSAIWLASGSDQKKFDVLMKMIPSECRRAMLDGVIHEAGELENDGGGHAYFSNEAAAAKIAATLEGEDLELKESPDAAPADAEAKPEA